MIATKAAQLAVRRALPQVVALQTRAAALSSASQRILLAATPCGEFSFVQTELFEIDACWTDAPNGSIRFPGKSHCAAK